MLGQTLVLMQMTFLNNVRKVGRLVLSRTSCFYKSMLLPAIRRAANAITDTFSMIEHVANL
jgi:hypothetical protein